VEGSGYLIYHLDGNKLGVEVIPSLCRDSVAAAIGTDLIRWAESGGARDCLLPVLGGDTTLIFLSLTSLVWLYDPTSKKSPDNSFIAANIQIPPGKPIGTSNVCYPNVTVEVAKAHESWDQLLPDAAGKHFSATTGVMAYVGVKIFPSRRIRVCLLVRNVLQGFGYIDPPLADTRFINIDAPSNMTIVVPKDLIFFGVPPALVPPTVTPNYNLDVDMISQRCVTFWDV
jgi:hypothetical protein